MNLIELEKELRPGSNWWQRAARESLLAGRLQVIGTDDDIYIARFFLHHVETDPDTGKLLSANSAFLHRIVRPDDGRDLHNHPWDFSTKILSGGYLEEFDGIAPHRVFAGEYRSRWHSTFHRIAAVDPETWTLVTTGPRINDWGFLVDGRFVPWREYLKA